MRFSRVITKFLLCILLSLLSVSSHAAVKVVATRVWPAQDYTRITLESSQPLQYNLQLLKNPSRLVLDLKDTELTPALKTITDKILSSDPYIKQIRVGMFKPDTVRFVVDLKAEIRPELFSLNPAGGYQHRLVLDIYPFDPMMALIKDKKPSTAISATDSVKTPQQNAVVTSTLGTTPKNNAQNPPLEPLAKPVETITLPNTNDKSTEPITNKSTTTVAVKDGVDDSTVVTKPLEVSGAPELANAHASPKPKDVTKQPTIEKSALEKPETEKQTQEKPMQEKPMQDKAITAQANNTPSTNTQTVEKPPSVTTGQESSGSNATAAESSLNSLPKPESAKTTEVMTNPSPTVDKQDDRLITIVIDAGHGGEDPGARGANGSHEKDITLKIAKKLKQRVDEEPNMRGLLTRDADFFIPLHGRVVKARNLKADLFVSIHADAFTNQSARGSSVFALSEKGATSAGARYLAKKENESDLIGGVSLSNKDPELARTLLDLSQTATINDSLKLGKAVLGKIGEINKLHKNQVEQAGFAVLKSPDIPSILVETAFISNPEEEARLNDDDYQDKLVNAILSGIKKYFASNPALAKSKAI